MGGHRHVIARGRFERERGDRDVTFVDRLLVRVGHLAVVDDLAADPEVLAAAGIDARDDLLFVDVAADARSRARHAPALWAG